MTFDGDEINVGDKLVDFMDGIVTVKQVYRDAIVVQFRSRGGRAAIRNYNYKGVASNRSVKTLFWQDINNLIVPRKNTQAWQAQVAMIKAATNAIGKIASDPAVLRDDLQDTSDLTLAEATDRGLVDGNDARQLAAQRGALVSEEVVTHTPPSLEVS